MDSEELWFFVQVGLYIFDDLFTRVCNKESDWVLKEMTFRSLRSVILCIVCMYAA